MDDLSWRVIVARVVRSAVAEAGLRPRRITTALWLTTGSRWSDELGDPRRRSIGEGVFDAGLDVGFQLVASLVESLFNLP